jgi:signal transduction histidine kinase
MAEETFAEVILANLIGNADKYSSPGDPIDVTLVDSGNEVEFHVSDRGPGVEPAELGLLFDSFYRSKRTAELPGKGLGLSICKRLVEAQGGRIWAELRRGGGLEVTFTLPSGEPREENE